MDFLPLPDGKKHPELVPDLGGPSYDNLGFEGYPLRQGWNLEKLLAGDIVGARDEWDNYSQEVLQDVSPDKLPKTNEDLIKAVVGPFIQTWIFYGLFHEALDRPILRIECSIQVLNEDGSAKTYLTARRLFLQFMQRKSAIQNDLAWCRRFSACTRFAAWALQSLDETSAILEGFVIPGIVHLSLAILVQLLDDYSVIFCQPHIIPANASVGRCRWLEGRLLDGKWCPNMVRRLRTDLGIEGLYYASLLEAVVGDQPHDTCYDTHCVAYNFKEGQEYRLQHAQRYCLCKDQSCSHDDDSCPCSEPSNMDEVAAQVAAIIYKGGIPLLSLIEEGRVIRVAVTQFTHGVEYTAISHVWSDGMGNPYKNSLPLCILQELDYFVRHAQISPKIGQYHFWIDTICVPRQPDELRWAAIEPMREVYHQAECVLVMCRELAWLKLPSLPEEILVRIFRSKWMTRLWTLQEGALAQRLAFQFEDHAIDYGYLYDRMVAGLVEGSTFSRLVGNRANLALTDITSIISSESYDQGEYRDAWSALWSALRHRCTSRRSDEAICASILLGSDLGPVLKAPNEIKMQVFWTEQNRVPSGVLWVNGPRLRIDSLRWAPASLLDVRTWALSLPSGGPLAIRTDDGLVIQGNEGFWLRDLPLPEGKNSALEFCDTRTAENYYVYRMENVENANWVDLHGHWAQVALVWREKPKPEAFSAGALVSCHGVENETIYARWLLQVSVFTKNFADLTSILRERSEFLDGRIQHTAAPIVNSRSVEFIQPKQRWCIS